MKKYLIVSLIVISLVYFLPWLSAVSASPQPNLVDQTAPDTALPSQDDPSSYTVEHIATGEWDSSVILTVLIDGVAVTMDLGTYLVGVVRAEMPASFSPEALKAQAVAARTYTLYKMLAGGSANHPGIDTCTDINCCKAYMEYAVAAAQWGELSEEYEAKLRAAVTETDGECVLYAGEPVLAVFHSSSAGMTLNAEDVWSSAVPYLVSVASPENEELVPNFCSEASFSTASLRMLLRNAYPDANLDGSPSTWFTASRQLSNGTVTSLCVGGVTVTGAQLRTLLGLRSACFTLSFEDDQVIFSVKGYGHGVGMSQYGANLLAQNGMTYRDILSWYYTGTIVAVYQLPSHVSHSGS